MAVNTTTTATTVAEPVPETITVTIRVPANATGTLTDAATNKIMNINSVTDVTLLGTGSISPRNGATYVTVTVELTTNAVTGDDLFDDVEDTIGVELADQDAVT